MKKMKCCERGPYISLKEQRQEHGGKILTSSLQGQGFDSSHWHREGKNHEKYC
jgi:hypothetical protein